MPPGTGFNGVWVFDPAADHLEAAANTDHFRLPAPGQGEYVIGQAHALNVGKIFNGVFAARQHHHVGLTKVGGPPHNAQPDIRLHCQGIEIGKIGNMG